MVDIKNDPKTAPPASPSPATQPGADLNNDLDKLKPPNLIDPGVDRMLEGLPDFPGQHSAKLEGPADFRGLHYAKLVAKKFSCTIGPVKMIVEIVEIGGKV